MQSLLGSDSSNEKAARALMVDLGLARREKIVTTDFRHYREAHGQQLEDMRLSNQPGTKEYQVAQKNLGALNAWSTFHQQEDLGNEDSLNEAEPTGQTHRLRVHNELTGGHTEGSRGRGGKGQQVGHGRGLGRGRVKELPTLLGPAKPSPVKKLAPVNQSPPPRRSNMESNVHSQTKAEQKPFAMSNEISAGVGHFSSVPTESPRYLGTQNKQSNGARITMHSLERSSDRDPQYTGHLASGDDFMASASNVFAIYRNASANSSSVSSVAKRTESASSSDVAVPRSATERPQPITFDVPTQEATTGKDRTSMFKMSESLVSKPVLSSKEQLQTSSEPLYQIQQTSKYDITSMAKGGNASTDLIARAVSPMIPAVSTVATDAIPMGSSHLHAPKLETEVFTLKNDFDVQSMDKEQSESRLKELQGVLKTLEVMAAIEPKSAMIALLTGLLKQHIVAVQERIGSFDQTNAGQSTVSLATVKLPSLPTVTEAMAKEETPKDNTMTKTTPDVKIQYKDGDPICRFVESRETEPREDVHLSKRKHELHLPSTPPGGPHRKVRRTYSPMDDKEKISERQASTPNDKEKAMPLRELPEGILVKERLHRLEARIEEMRIAATSSSRSPSRGRSTTGVRAPPASRISLQRTDPTSLHHQEQTADASKFYAGTSIDVTAAKQKLSSPQRVLGPAAKSSSILGGASIHAPTAEQKISSPLQVPRRAATGNSIFGGVSMHAPVSKQTPSNSQPALGPAVETGTTRGTSVHQLPAVVRRFESQNQQGASADKPLFGGKSMWATQSPPPAHTKQRENLGSKGRRPPDQTPTKPQGRQQRTGRDPNSPEWNKLFDKYQRPVKHELPRWLAKHVEQSFRNDPNKRT